MAGLARLAALIVLTYSAFVVEQPLFAGLAVLGAAAVSGSTESGRGGRRSARLSSMVFVACLLGGAVLIASASGGVARAAGALALAAAFVFAVRVGVAVVRSLARSGAAEFEFFVLVRSAALSFAVVLVLGAVWALVALVAEVPRLAPWMVLAVSVAALGVVENWVRRFYMR